MLEVEGKGNYYAMYVIVRFSPFGLRWQIDKWFLKLKIKRLSM